MLNVTNEKLENEKQAIIFKRKTLKNLPFLHNGPEMRLR